MTVLVDDILSTNNEKFRSLGKRFTGGHHPCPRPAPRDCCLSQENGCGPTASSGLRATYPYPPDTLLPRLVYANQLAFLGEPGYVPLRAALVQS